MEEVGQAHPSAALPGKTVPEDKMNTYCIMSEMNKLVD